MFEIYKVKIPKATEPIFLEINIVINKLNNIPIVLKINTIDELFSKKVNI